MASLAVGRRRKTRTEMKCSLYSRVSTTEQSVNMQLDELRSYCGRRGLEIVREYVDAGVSGAKGSRPALNRLMADARRRGFDAVLVYRYDRFARSLRQLVNALAEFDALGVDFISLHEGVDTSTPAGRLIFGIFASIAEFERALIAERVRSGQAAAKRRGVIFGRSRAIGSADVVAPRLSCEKTKRTSKIVNASVNRPRGMPFVLIRHSYTYQAQAQAQCGGRRLLLDGCRLIVRKEDKTQALPATAFCGCDELVPIPEPAGLVAGKQVRASTILHDASHMQPFGGTIARYRAYRQVQKSRRWALSRRKHGLVECSPAQPAPSSGFRVVLSRNR
jgi:DNA invertase Pin-like site-specific DNA recombinase